MNPDWLLPDWPAPANVHAVFTTRAGGYSVQPYGSMNLGCHVDDEPLNVESNRSVLSEEIGCTPTYLNQVHGVDICRLPAESTGLPPQADGVYTQQAAQVCTVMVADCLPVLFCDVYGTAIAAAHAGWRGLAGAKGYGVLEAAVKEFSSENGVNTARHAPELIAWLGPCIGQAAFEVGPEVREVFLSNDAEADACFVAHGRQKWRCDLAGLARQRLAKLGVSSVFGNDSGTTWCTVANPSRFFSFRRDRVTGRMAACVWMR